MKEKFKHEKKIKFNWLKKRLIEINGTNYSVYDLQFSIQTDKKKKKEQKLEAQTNSTNQTNNSEEFEDSIIEIIGLKDLLKFKNIQFTAPANQIDLIKTPSHHEIAYITTDFIGFDEVEFEEATITLPKLSKTDSVIICNDYDSSSNTCNSWSSTATPFEEQEDSISFKVNHFSGWAGANITILNVQSYPVVGGNWAVRFTTTGSAPLTITAVENTYFGADLEFQSLKCGESLLSPEFNGTSIYEANYSCEFEGSEESKVLSSGEHTLEFRFGDAIAYAHNLATTLKWYLWDTASELAGSYKRLNTTTIIANPTSYSNTCTAVCDYNAKFVTPPLNSSQTNKSIVNGTFYGSITARGLSTPGYSFNLTAIFFKYNRTGGDAEIGRNTSFANVTCDGGFYNLPFNLTIPSSINTSLYVGERLGVRFAANEGSCNGNWMQIFWNRSDTYLFFTNESLTQCGSLTTNYNQPEDFYIGSSTCYQVQAHNVNIDCNGHNVGGIGSHYGINISGYDNITIKNCIISNFKTGIYAFNSNNLTILNTTILDQSNGVGINIINSTLANITQTYISRVKMGINLTNANNVTIDSINISAGSGIRIYINASNYTTILNSNFSGGTWGLEISYGDYGNVTNNWFFGGQRGIYSLFDDAVYYWSFISNTIENNTQYGFWTYGNPQSYKLFKHAKFSDNIFRNNSLANIRIGSAGSAPLSFSENNFTNNLLYPAPGGFDLNYSGAQSNNFLNNSLNRTLISWDATAFGKANLTFQNYKRVNATDFNFVGIYSAIINITNSTLGAQNYLGVYTSSNGLTNFVVVNEFLGNNTANTTIDSYNISASYGGSINSTIAFSNTTKTELVMLDVSACGTITGVHILGNDVVASGTCFTFGADHTVLDCNGYSIRGSNTGNGVNFNGKTNGTVKNCGVSAFDTSIYAYSASNFSLYNSNFSNSIYGIRVCGVYGNVSNNFIYNNSGIGINLNNACFANINDVRIYSNVIENNTAGLRYDIYSFSYFHNTTINNNTFRNNSETNLDLNSITDPGAVIFGHNATGNIFITSPTGADLNITKFQNLFFINNTFNRDKVGFGTNANMTIQNYIRVNVTDKLLQPLNGALIDIFNTTESGAMNYYGLPSNADGVVDYRLVTEFYGDYGSHTNITYYNISGTYEGSTNSTLVNVNESKTVWLIIPGCSKVSTSTMQTENQNGVCINIAANDIVYDCNGYRITGDGTGYGFNVTDLDNVTVKNCIIGNFVHGILLNSSTSFTLINSTISDSINDLRSDASNFTNITDSIFYGNTSGYGIQATESHNLSVWNSRFQDSVKGIFTYDSYNITVRNSLFDTNVEGITLSDGRYAFIRNVSIGGAGTGIGANFTNFDNGTIKDANISRATYSLYAINSENATVSNSNTTCTIDCLYYDGGDFPIVDFVNITGDSGSEDAIDARRVSNMSVSNSKFFNINQGIAYNTAPTSNLFVVDSDITLKSGGSNGIALASGGTSAIFRNVTIYGGFGTSNGIVTSGGWENVTFERVTVMYANDGIELNSNDGARIIDSNLTGNTNGIFLTSAQWTDTINNTITNNTYGIYEYSAISQNPGNYFYGNIIQNNTQVGMWLHAFGVSGNIKFQKIANNTFRNNTIGNLFVYGSTFQSPDVINNNNFTSNVFIHSPNGYDINITNSQSNFFLNNSFNRSRLIFQADAGGISNSTFQSYIRVNATDSIFNVIPGASVNVTNSSSSSTNYIGLTTNTDGITNYQTVTYFYGNNSVNTSLPNYNFSASSGGVINSTIDTVNETKTVLVILPIITSCGTVSSSGTLANDLNSTGTCLAITSPNIILDCAGRNITGKQNGVGVQISGVNNVILRNCVIINYTSGIALQLNSNNASLLNNTLINNTQSGISANLSNNLTIINNSFTSNMNYSIYLNSTWFSNLSRNIIHSQIPPAGGNEAHGINGTGFYLFNFSYNYLADNNLSNIYGGRPDSSSGFISPAGGWAIGISLVNSSNNTFQRNLIYNLTASRGGDASVGLNGGPGGGAIGIYLHFSLNNTFTNGYLINATGYAGGTGGSTIGTGGNGGTGGSVYGIYAIASTSIFLNNFNISFLMAGSGGNGGTAATAGNGGDGGNSSFIYLESSNSAIILNSNFTNSTGGRNGTTPAGTGLMGLPGSGFGIQFINSNSGVVNSTIINNVSAVGAANATGLIAPIHFSGSSLNGIYDSILHYDIFNGMNYSSVFSERSSQNNVLQNITFNARNLTWGSGNNNLSMRWPIDVIVRFGNMTPAQGATVTIRNSTSDNIQFSGATDANGLVSTQIVTEFNGNTTNTTYNPHNISADLTDFPSGSSNETIESYRFITLFLNEIPTVALNLPDNNAWNDTRNINFSFTPMDDGPFANCSVWTNNTGTFAQSQLNQSEIVNGSLNYINFTFSADGSYIWNVRCFEAVAASQGSFASSNYTINIDTYAPENLTTVAPTLANNSNTSNNWAYINMTLDETNTETCWVQWYNGSYNNLTMSRENTNCYLNITGQPDGSWNYDLFANDSAGNIGSNSSHFINIDTQAPSAITTVTPTLANNSNTSNNWVFVNVTFTESYPHICTLQYSNGSLQNYTMTRENNNCYLNITSQPDGNWNYTVIVNDTTGNSNQNGSFFITVDTLAPSAITTISPTLANNSNTSNNWAYINMTLDETNTETCWVQWYNGSYNNLTMSRENTNCYLNITGQPDGSWNYDLFANDSAGNIGSNLSFFINIDRNAPADIITIAPTLTNYTNTSNNWLYVNVTFTETFPETCTLQYNNGSLQNYSMTRENTNCYINMTGQEDGNWNYTVIVNDSSGNYGENGTFFVMIDTTFPLIQFVNMTPQDNANLSQSWVYVNLTFTEINQHDTLLNWNGTNETLSCTAGICAVNKTSLVDGSYSFYAYMNDTAGNANQTEVRSILIDTVWPANLTTVSPTLSNNSNTSNNWVHVNVTFNETNPYTCILQYNNGSLQNYSMTRENTNCYINMTGQDDGDYNYTIIVNDTTGHSAENGSFFITVDTLAPSAITTISPTLANNSNTSNNWVYINFTYTEINAQTCWVYWHNTSYYNLTMTRENNNCYLNITEQSDGNWDYSLWVNDSAGNIGSNLSHFINVDANAPADITTVSPTLANNTNTSNNWLYVNVTFTETFPDTCTLQYNNGSLQNYSMTRENTNCYLNMTSQSDGNWNYTVIVNDTTGNSNQNGSFFITVDTLAPSAITTISPTLANNSNTSNNWVYINTTFTEINAETCTLQYNNGTLANYAMVREASNCYLNLTAQPEGDWNYTIIVNDSAGNLGENGTFFLTVDLTAPTDVITIFPTLENNTRIHVDWVFVNSTFTENRTQACTLQWNNGSYSNLSMTRDENNCYLNLTNQPLGAWNYTIIVNDSAGNMGENGTFFIHIWANTSLNYIQYNQTYGKNGVVNITSIFSRDSLRNFTNQTEALQFNLGNGTNITINDFNISLNFSDQPTNSSYFASGIYERTIDSGFSNAHWLISWNATTFANAPLIMQAAVSRDNVTFTDFLNLTNSSGSIVNGTPARYMKYRALFLSDGTASAFLSIVNVTALFGINGNLTVNLTNNNTGQTLLKSCIAINGNCSTYFLFPGDLPGGNYSVNIAASNTSAFNEFSTLLYYSYFEESMTGGSLQAPTADTDSNMWFLINVSLTNRINGSMHNPVINYSDKGDMSAIDVISTTCGALLSPGLSCNSTFNVTVPNLVPGSYGVIWNASFTTNNVTNITITNTSNVDISITPAVSANITSIIISTNISQSNITIFKITNTGNINLANITASVVPDNINISWFTFNPTVKNGLFPSTSYDLTVTVAVSAPYTPGTYTGKINITADTVERGKNSTSTFVNVTVIVDPQIAVNPSNLTANTSLSSNQTLNATISNPGNAPLTNASVSIINSTSALWDAATNSFTQISEGAGVVLEIIVHILDYLAGVFSALIQITSNEGQTTYINITINVTPELTAVDNINLTASHGKLNISSFFLNSTGNVKLVNMTISYINETLPSSWISINPASLENITEGVNYSVSLNVSVPWGQPPGNYTGILNISGYNANKTINLTVHVPTDTSWHYLPGGNQTKEFGLAESGIVGTITINNTGNVNLTFTLGYSDWDGRASCLFPSNFCGAGQGSPPNPSSVSALKNTTTSFSIRKTSSGASNNSDGYALNISMTNVTGSPNSNYTLLFFNITNAPPKIIENNTYVGTIQTQIVEFNQTIILNVTATDDEVWGLDATTAIFNISRPDGTNQTFIATNTTLDPFEVCSGVCQDAQAYIFAFNYTNVTGAYNVTFQVDDASAQRNMTVLSFQVVSITNLTLSGNNTNVSNVQKTGNTTLLLNISINNTGLVNAYSINLSGQFSRLGNASDTLANWSFFEIPAIPFLNGTNQNITTFNITIGERSLGIYYFTPNVTFIQPNGTIETIWGRNITIDVLSNPNFTISISNQSLALQHGTYQSEWFTITPTGNVNVSNYNITFSTNYTDFTVSLSNTTGNITLEQIANISMNISVNYSAISGFRNFTINFTSGNLSQAFLVNLTVPFNNTWELNANNITTNGIAGDNALDSQTLITHVGTGDAYLNFSLNLTGNMTAFSNLLNYSVELNSSQNFTIYLNYTAPDTNNQYIGVLNVTEANSSSTQFVNVTFNSFTVEVHVHAIYSPAEVLAGDPINITARLVFGGQNQTVNTTWRTFVDSTTCNLFANSTTGNFTNLNCTSPAAADAVYHNVTIEANFTNGEVYLVKNATNVSAVFYQDITAPQFVEEQSNDTEQYYNITLVVNATDNYQLANTTAQVTFPNNTVTNFTMPFNSTSGLFSGQLNFTDLGIYSVNYITNDTSGNSNSSLNGSFEIYYKRLFNGSIINLEGHAIVANFSIANTSDGTSQNFGTNSTGYYNVTIRPRWNAFNMTFLFYNISISRVDFNTINQSFISLDNFTGSDIASQLPGAKAGFGAITQMDVNGTLTLDYSPLLSSISDESVLRLYQCSNYTYSTRTCAESWVQLTNVSLNTINNLIKANFTSFANNVSAFAIMQYSAPTPTPGPTSPPSTGGTSGTVYIDNTQPSTPTPTPTPTPSADNITAQIEELKRLLEQNKTQETGLEPGVQSLTFELFPGESTQTSIHLKNTLNITSDINISIVGGVTPFISVPRKTLKLNRLHETDLLVFASIPEGTKPANFHGELQFDNEVGRITIPILVRVLEKREEKLIDLQVQPLVDTLDSGEILRVEMNLYNLGDQRNIQGNFHLELVDPITDNITQATEPEGIVFQNTYNGIKSLEIPQGHRDGRFVIRGVYQYKTETGKDREVSAISYVRVQTSLWSIKLFGSLALWQLIPLLMIATASGLTYYRQYVIAKKKRRYIAKVDFTKLPEPGARAGYLGLVAETKVRAFVPLDKLQTHTLVAGATGSGKTVAAQVMVEEALQRKTAVRVFDPTAQWTGFLRQQKNLDMFSKYKNYGMTPDDARAFKGNIYIVRDPNMPLDIKKFMKPGEITVFVMNKLSFADHETFIANTVKQVFAAGLPEAQELKMLLVYDEVHRLLTKFGGRGEGFVQIERGAREFRKWGVGMILISQVLSDFVGEIKANIGTEIQMRTKYEGDLERLKMKFGADAARSIVKESIGSGMLQNSEYNNGQPYFVSFRPLLHNVMRLTDTELSQYETYNNQVEKLEREMEELRAKGQDVLDLELEINLARDKVKKGSFNIVEIYIESLEQKISSMKRKSGESKGDAADLGIGDIGLSSSDEKEGPPPSKPEEGKKDVI